MHTEVPDALAPASPWQLPARRNFRLVAVAVILAVGDLIVAALCAAVVHLRTVGSPGGLAATVLLFGVCTVAGMHLTGTHYPKESRRANELALRVLLGVVASCIATVAVSLAWPIVGRSGIVAYYLLALPSLTVWHLLGSRRPRAWFRPDSIAVVGSQEIASKIARSISDNDAFRLGPVLVPSPSGAVRVYNRGNASGAVAAVEDIPSIIDRENIGAIAVASALNRQSAELYRQLWNCRNKGIDVVDIEACLEMIDKKLSLDRLDAWHTPSLSFPGWDRRLDDKLKRIGDIFMAITGLILCAPVMLAVAAVIRWSDGGPVFYSQQRVGLLGRTYTLYKLRSMKTNAEPDGRPVFACVNDPRAFPFGRFIRHTHLDELPQLWNVLKGDMSMIGPRPERPPFVAQIRREVRYYDARHVTRPGITGWAQLNWPQCKHSGHPLEDARNKLEYELYYIRYRNILWDIHIAAKTVVFMLEALWRYRRA